MQSRFFRVSTSIEIETELRRGFFDRCESSGPGSIISPKLPEALSGGVAADISARKVMIARLRVLKLVIELSSAGLVAGCNVKNAQVVVPYSATARATILSPSRVSWRMPTPLPCPSSLPSPTPLRSSLRRLFLPASAAGISRAVGAVQWKLSARLSFSEEHGQARHCCRSSFSLSFLHPHYTANSSRYSASAQHPSIGNAL